MYRDDFVCKKCYELAKAERFTNGVAIVILILGVVLCFTGVGAIIGIPAIGISKLINGAIRSTRNNALTVYRVFKTIGIVIIGYFALAMLYGIGTTILDFIRYGF